jgi:16S rRNA (guanine527-N7)-methyltransferase
MALRALACFTRADVGYALWVADDDAACLERLAGELGFPLVSTVTGRIGEFVRLLVEWNARVNLTGARSALDVVGEHVVDAFAMARMVQSGSSVVDVGSGGGLPGLAFAILRPDARVTLVEPRAKRVAFLRTVLRELRLANAEVFHGRVEALGRAGFEVAASRATFPPDEWLTIGLNLVRPGGMVLVFAGDAWLPKNASLRAANDLHYMTASRRSLWIGAFCST